METNESILRRYNESYVPRPLSPKTVDPEIWRDIPSAPKRVEGSVPAGNLVFDPVYGEYVDSDTGIVYAADEVAESPEKSSRALKTRKQIPFDDWCESLLELACEGKANCKDGWKVNNPNPDTEIGQTVPWSEHLFEQCDNGNGITFSVPSGPYSHRVPNCVDIEHLDHPLKQDDGDNSHAEFSTLDTPQETIFEALEILALKLKKAPSAHYWKWLPTMIDFIADGISLRDSTGEISIPDLLSAFKTIRREKQDLLHLMKVNFEALVRAQQKVKQLRTQMYGHRKHKNFHMK